MRKSGTIKLAFVIPAYNAERTIGPLVTDLVARATALRDMTAPAVVVVDDGSDDATGSQAERAGAAVVRHSSNRGKGAALLTGFSWAYTAGARAAVSVDADGQHPPDQALALCRHPAPPEALLLGIRNLQAAGAPRKNRFSNGFSNAWMSLFAGRLLRDTQCGLRRYPIPEVLGLDLRSTGYELESEVILKAVRRGIPVVETDVRVIYPPEHERVTHFHSVRDPARIVLRILHTAFTTRGHRRAAP